MKQKFMTLLAGLLLVTIFGCEKNPTAPEPAPLQKDQELRDDGNRKGAWEDNYFIDNDDWEQHGW
ncbi:MAG: hypothetical protein ACTSPB_23670 [Candidatus Thorarchaeota archaeon]